MPYLYKKQEFRGGVRNLPTSLFGKVCKNVEIAPHLLSFENEKFDLRSANASPEARSDMKADGFNVTNNYLLS